MAEVTTDTVRLDVKLANVNGNQMSNTHDGGHGGNIGGRGHNGYRES